MDVSPSPPAAGKNLVQRGLERWLFRSRWLLAPFYAGLVLALFLLMVVFARKLWGQAAHFSEMTAEDAILVTLSLIDLSLAAALVLIVIISGYGNFVSRMDEVEGPERPGWMDSLDFSGVKLKLIGSIIAISAIGLLQAFMAVSEGEGPGDHALAWLVIIHLTLAISGVLLAWTDVLVARAAGGH